MEQEGAIISPDTQRENNSSGPAFNRKMAGIALRFGTQDSCLQMEFEDFRPGREREKSGL